MPKNSSVADVDPAFHDAARRAVEIAAQHGMSAVGVVFQIGVGVHDAPGMADADVRGVVVGALAAAADDLVDDRAGSVGGGDGADRAGAHVSVDHLHVDREQTSDQVDIFGGDGLAAAGRVIDGPAYESDLGQRLAVLSGVIEIFGEAQRDGAGAADDFEDAADFLAVRQGVELRRNFGAGDAEILRMDEDHGIGGVDEAVLVGRAVDGDGVFDMTGRQQLAGGRSLRRHELERDFCGRTGNAVDGEISFGDYTLEDGAVTADGKYVIFAKENSYQMIDTVGNKVEFFYNAKKQCVRIEVTAAKGHAVDDSPWLVVCKEFHGAAFTFGFCPVAEETALLTNTITEGVAFNELNAIFTAAMDYMGFKLGAGGQIWDSLFMAKIGAYCLAKDAVLLNCTENGGNNGGGKPPKTGDVASIMGFVMLAAAAVPAGVASFRKVRK